MNEPKNTDFFPETGEPDERLAPPEIYHSFVDSKDDILHEERLKEIEAEIDEKFGTASDGDLGELPYDAKADRKKWDKLEKDFDRVFEDAARRPD
jgi:hypothetical protein